MLPDAFYLILSDILKDEQTANPCGGNKKAGRKPLFKQKNQAYVTQ